MEQIGEFADRGGLVWGICNGFKSCVKQASCRGVIRNASLEFRCEWTNLVVERTDLAYTSQCADREVIASHLARRGQLLRRTGGLSRLEQNGRSYSGTGDPDGRVVASATRTASAQHRGIINKRGNVLGMMPHPERCAEAELGSADGLKLFKSVAGSALRGWSREPGYGRSARRGKSLLRQRNIASSSSG